MCGGGYPNPIGRLISALESGDEIIILKGEGYPAVDQETTTVVWIVSGYSALCTNGTTISCDSISDLIQTGLKHDRFEISDAAREMEQLAHLRRSEEEQFIVHDSDMPDWSVPAPFPPEPE